MFTTASSTNYRCTEGLLIWYEQEMLDTAGYIKITRHATKSYAFLDLTAEAAVTVAAAKVAQYTRAFAAWTLSGSTITQATITECRSTIANTETGAGSYDVTIAVNESDEKIVTSNSFVSNPATYFTTEDARDYDDAIHAKTTQGLSLYSRRTNFNVSENLTVTYRVARSSAGSGYEYTRYATKSFEYKGMNQETAENCAKAKRAQYTRQYSFLSGTTNKSRIVSGAAISLSHAGITWSVKARINETDVKYSSTNVTPASLFTTENNRSYEGSDLLALESVALGEEVSSTRVEATATATFNLPDHEIEDATFKYRVGEDLTWATASVEWSEGVGVWVGVLVLPKTDEEIYCKLVCAGTESDVIIAS